MRISRRDVIANMSCTAAAAMIGNRSSAMGRAGADAMASDAEDGKHLLAYFAKNAPLLLREPQGLLKYPSIAPSLPGKAYNAQLWDWDTLWTARGLFATACATGDDALHARVAEHAKGSLQNFFAAQGADGRLPIMMTATNADWFQSMDLQRNQAKPVMAQIALLVADETGELEWLSPLIDGLARFHASWLKTNRSSTGLLVWSNGIAIGNDNDPTASGRPAFSSAHLLLNCLYWADLCAAGQLAGRLGKLAMQAELERQAETHGELIRTVLWDPRDRFFYSHDVQIEDDRVKYIPKIPRGMDFSYRSLPLRIACFTGFLPLWCGVASPEQAGAVLDNNWRADDHFQAAFGCRTLSSRETMYSMAMSGNPSNWLGPVWTIANYFVWRALSNFGNPGEADSIARATIRLLAADLRNSGSLNEYYHPDTGSPLSHAGFMDWNLLVLEMIAAVNHA